MASNVLIKALRALGLLDRLDWLLPEPGISPIERLKGQKHLRQRARKKKVLERPASPFKHAPRFDESDGA